MNLRLFYLVLSAVLLSACGRADRAPDSVQPEQPVPVASAPLPAIPKTDSVPSEPQSSGIISPVGGEIVKGVPGTPCEQAGGRQSVILECDGSESLWCRISDREQCYADDVRNGKCSVGKYSEKEKKLTGIVPKIICKNGVAVRSDSLDKQKKQSRKDNSLY